MKKKLLIIFLLLFTVILTGCSKKVALSVDEFKTKVEDNKYSVVDVKDQFNDYEYIKNSYLAVDSSKEYQIEFYILSNNDYASKFYQNNKSIFQTNKGNNNSETEINLKTYEKYTLNSNGTYMLLSRIDNTILYAKVDNKYKDKVNDIVKKLGY